MSKKVKEAHKATNRSKHLSDSGLEKQLEALLKECEGDLLKMALVEAKGEKLEDYEFYSPVFRFIWTKISKLLGEDKLRKQSQFYKKGMGF